MGFHGLRRSVLGVLSTAVVAAGLVAVAAPAANAVTCKPYTIIGVRGTDDGTKASLGKRLPTAVSAFKVQKGSTNVTTTYVSYPASLDYVNSMNDGRAALKSKISSYLSACKTTKLVLFGYSQGAHIVGDVVVGLSLSQRARIQGVGLIGDPMMNPKLGIAKTADTSRGGMWGRRGAWPASVFLYNVCNKNDKVCASQTLANSLVSLGKPEHQDYTTSKYSPVSGASGAWLIGYHVAKRA